ncbi:MAG: hypothetical protein ABJH63_01140 [Rhizobiaceae bacterium]
MLISALANFGNAHMSTGEKSSNSVEAVVLVDKSAPSDDAPMHSHGNDLALAEKDDCPCKKDHSPSKFVCGVTLALLDSAAALHTPNASKARFVLNKSTSVPDFVDQLKRPPRTIL